jgi:glutamine amidotransferase
MNVVIDYGMGNLRSIITKLSRIGFDAIISSSKNDIIKATKLIIPGVGAFGTAMHNLHELQLLTIIEKKVLEEKIPIMGICLGMQLMTRWSAEGNVQGLGWVDAVTLSLRERSSNAIVPHMGWNTISKKKNDQIINNIPDNSEFYFVHSYYVHCNNSSDIITTTDHGGEFVSIFRKENIIGTQFHPEKSHDFGIAILKNFMELKIC